MISSTFITLSLSTLALLSSVTAGSSEFTQIVKRDTVVAAGSTPLRFKGLVSITTGIPVNDVGTSNPVANSADIVSQTQADENTATKSQAGVESTFGKRDTGAIAVVSIGTSNPVAPLGDINSVSSEVKASTGVDKTIVNFVATNVKTPGPKRDLGNVNTISHHLATRGLPGGEIQMIETRSHSEKEIVKRQTGAKPFVQLGTSNPTIDNAQTNALGDVNALTGVAQSLLAFDATKVATLIPGIPAPAVRRDLGNVNLISHHLATRGLAGGEIQVIEA